MVLEGQVTILKIRTGSDTRTGSRNFAESNKETESASAKSTPYDAIVTEIIRHENYFNSLFIQ
jgi:hypothetical protein